MKNFSKAKRYLKDYFKSITLFLLVLIGTGWPGSANAQVTHKAEGTIQLSVGSDQYLANLVNSSLVAEGNFVIKDGALDEISFLKLAGPLNSDHENSNTAIINFKITNIMVLPIMKKVFIVGALKKGSESYNIDMDFDFVMDQNRTISLRGERAIKLSDYYKFQKGPIVSFVSVRDTDELKLNINLLFKQVEEKLVVVLPSTSVETAKVENESLFKGFSKSTR